MRAHALPLLAALALACAPSGRDAGPAAVRTAATAAACAPGFHACDAACVEDGPESCGDACAACPSPDGAIAACVAGTCGWRCGAGLRACGERCVALDDASACGPDCAACPGAAHGAAVCRAGACAIACDPGFVACGGACVPRDGAGWAVQGVLRPAGSATGYLATADVDRDGVLDVVARTGLNVEIHRTKPSAGTAPREDWPILPGTVRSYQPEGEERVVVADLDGDGWKDLVTFEKWLRTVAILLNRRDGTFDVSYLPVDPAPVSVCAGDADGDAIPDLAIALMRDGDHGDWALARGRGDGTFGAPEAWVADAWGDAVCPDLDGDLRIDLVQAGSVRLSSEAWRVAHAWPAVSPRFGFAVGPLSGAPGGAIVVVGETARTTGAQVSVLPLGADGLPGRERSWPSYGGGNNQVAIGDVDLDGLPDVALPPLTVVDDLVLRRGTADGGLGPELTIAAAAEIGGVATGDLDGDGWPDVAVGAPTGVEIVRGGCAF